MLPSRQYYMLVTSLPALPSRYDAGRLPISLLKLQDRLRLLVEEDWKIVESLSEFFVWDRQPLDRTDQKVWQAFQQLRRVISNTLAREVIDYRIDMRTVVAGLRRKRFDEGPMDGFGDLATWIRRHWNQPYFELTKRYPWIVPFSDAVESGKLLDAQRVLFNDLWTKWTRLSQQFHFTIETIVLYLARWEIVERWTSLDATEGRRRFDFLLSETMGEYANLF